MMKLIKWIHVAYNQEASYELSQKQVNIIASLIKEKIKFSDLTITEIADFIGSEIKLDIGTGLFVIKHLISRKKLIVNIKEKIYLRAPIRLIVKYINDEIKEV